MMPNTTRDVNMKMKLSLAVNGDSPVMIADKNIAVKMTLRPPKRSDRKPPSRLGKM